MDTTPIAERLRRNRSSLKHLHELQDTSRDEFIRNYLISSTVERQFQVAIQAATGIAQDGTPSCPLRRNTHPLHYSRASGQASTPSPMGRMA